MRPVPTNATVRPPAVNAAVREMRLRWFLLNPGDQTHWSDEIAAHPVFEMNGYRLYRF